MLQAELCYIPCIESVGQNLSKEIDLCHVDSWVILTRCSTLWYSRVAVAGTVVVVGWLDFVFSVAPARRT